MVQFYIVCMLYTVECFYHTELTCLVCVAFLSCLCSTVIVADVLLDSYSCKGDVMCLTAIFHLIFFCVFYYCMYDVCDSYSCFYAVRCCN